VTNREGGAGWPARGKQSFRGRRGTPPSGGGGPNPRPAFPGEILSKRVFFFFFFCFGGGGGNHPSNGGTRGSPASTGWDPPTRVAGKKRSGTSRPGVGGCTFRGWKVGRGEPPGVSSGNNKLEGGAGIPGQMRGWRCGAIYVCMVLKENPSDRGPFRGGGPPGPEKKKGPVRNGAAAFRATGPHGPREWGDDRGTEARYGARFHAPKGRFWDRGAGSTSRPVGHSEKKFGGRRRAPGGGGGGGHRKGGPGPLPPGGARGGRRSCVGGKGCRRAVGEKHFGPP